MVVITRRRAAAVAACRKFAPKETPTCKSALKETPTCTSALRETPTGKSALKETPTCKSALKETLACNSALKEAPTCNSALKETSSCKPGPRRLMRIKEKACRKACQKTASKVATDGTVVCKHRRLKSLTPAEAEKIAAGCVGGRLYEGDAVLEGATTKSPTDISRLRGLKQQARHYHQRIGRISDEMNKSQWIELFQAHMFLDPVLEKLLYLSNL